MTNNNIKYLFEPRSIAIGGESYVDFKATDDPLGHPVGDKAAAYRLDIRVSQK